MQIRVSDGRNDNHEMSDVSDALQQVRRDAGHAVGGEVTRREYVDHERRLWERHTIRDSLSILSAALTA